MSTHEEGRRSHAPGLDFYYLIFQDGFIHNQIYLLTLGTVSMSGLEHLTATLLTRENGDQDQTYLCTGTMYDWLAESICSFRDATMLGRYYEEFEIDIQRGVANYSQLLLQEALNFISTSNVSQPYFLYWAPDSTHGPWYSSPAFLGSSTRFPNLKTTPSD